MTPERFSELQSMVEVGLMLERKDPCIHVTPEELLTFLALYKTSVAQRSPMCIDCGTSAKHTDIVRREGSDICTSCAYVRDHDIQ